MKHDFTRRDFLAASAAFGASAVAVGRLGTDRRLVAAPFKTTLQKALIGAADERLSRQRDQRHAERE